MQSSKISQSEVWLPLVCMWHNHSAEVHADHRLMVGGLNQYRPIDQYRHSYNVLWSSATGGRKPSPLWKRCHKWSKPIKVI